MDILKAVAFLATSPTSDEFSDILDDVLSSRGLLLSSEDFLKNIQEGRELVLLGGG